MKNEIDILQLVASVDWDDSNISKNKNKHNVDTKEAQEAILDRKSKVLYDVKHSIDEERYTLFGKTLHGRLLTVIFTVRNKLFRVISARDQNRRERKFYETKT